MRLHPGLPRFAVAGGFPGTVPEAHRRRRGSRGCRGAPLAGPAGLRHGLGTFVAALPGRVDEDVRGHAQPLGELPVDLACQVLRLVAADVAAEVHPVSWLRPMPAAASTSPMTAAVSSNSAAFTVVSGLR